MFSLFGESDPHGMPRHFFWGCLRLEYTSAVRADTSRQNFTVAPRHWYIDAVFPCERCRAEFCFTAAEQKAWYEDLRFYVDSFPKRCPDCRRETRRLKTLRQEYDREIARALTSDDLDLKVRVAAHIDRLVEAGAALPTKVHANRALLARQVARRIGPDPPPGLAPS